MRIMLKVAILGLALCILVVIAIPQFYKTSNIKAYTSLVAYYPFEVDGHHPDTNYTQFLNDTRMIKQLGFDGVKMFNVEQYYNANILEKCLDRFKEMKLKVAVTFYLFDASTTPYNYTQDWFPDNKTKLNVFLDYMKEVCLTVKPYDHVTYYALHYPRHVSNFPDKITTSDYHWSVQELVNAIWDNDPYHPIYLMSEGIERFEVCPPLNMVHVSGIGIQPYPEIKDDYGVKGDHDIKWTMEYYEKRTDWKICIDEWGLRTYNLTEPDYALVSNENEKSELINDYLDYIATWDITWTYFGLHDHWMGDFGLLEDDNGMKLSGQTIMDRLKG